ncbi:MAG: ribonuclease HI family protein [Patescibacteria group bacterium]|jgi:ribonuclease HI
MNIKYAKLKIYTDGGARGNPGPAACGVVIKDETGKVISQHSKYLGVATNNQAEYEGVLLAFAEAQKLGVLEIDFYLDSLLVVKQLSLEYKVKEAGLQVLFLKAWNLSKTFKKITYTHIPREQNKAADKMVNLELDKQAKQ